MREHNENSRNARFLFLSLSFFFSLPLKVNCALSVRGERRLKFSEDSRIQTRCDNPVGLVVYIYYELFHAFLTRFSPDTKPALATLIKEALLVLLLSRFPLLSLFVPFSFFFSPFFFSPLRTSSPSSRVPSRVSERTKDREIRGKRFRNLAALVRRGAKPSLMAPSERALADGNINFRDLPSLLFFLVFPFPPFLVFFFLLLFLLFFSFFEDRILLQHCRLFVADSDALSSDTAIRNRGLIYGQFVTVRFPWIFLWSDIARDFFFPPFCCTLDRFQDIPVFLISWCKVENNK